MPDRKPLDALPASVRADVRKATGATWFAPMLATLTEERFSRAGWLFEPKFDGERALAFRQGEEVRLMSRNQKILNEKYPELVAAFESQEQESFIVDGEIVTFLGK